MPGYESENAYKELQDHELYVLTGSFKMPGDSTRIHVLFLLMEQDACVSDLADRLDMTRSAVFHQLSLLKANKLVRQPRSSYRETSTSVGLCELLVRHIFTMADSDWPAPNDLLSPSITGIYIGPKSFDIRLRAVSKRCQIKDVPPCAPARAGHPAGGGEGAAEHRPGDQARENLEGDIFVRVIWQEKSQQAL